MKPFVKRLARDIVSKSSKGGLEVAIEHSEVSLGRHEHSRITWRFAPWSPVGSLGMATPSDYQGSCGAADSLQFSPFPAPFMAERARATSDCARHGG